MSKIRKKTDEYDINVVNYRPPIRLYKRNGRVTEETPLEEMNRKEKENFEKLELALISQTKSKKPLEESFLFEKVAEYIFGVEENSIGSPETKSNKDGKRKSKRKSKRKFR